MKRRYLGDKDSLRVSTLIKIAILLGMILLVFLVVVNDNDNYKNYKINVDETVEVDGGYFIDNDYNAYYDFDTKTFYIEGIIEKRQDYFDEKVEIVFNLYDKDNVILGKSYAVIKDVDEKGKWKFVAEYKSKDASLVKRFKFMNIKIK